MSDEAQGDRKVALLKAVTHDDFRLFLAEKNVHAGCSQCGHQETSVVVQKSGKRPAIPSFDIPPDQFDTVVNYYFQLICPNCGSIRLFDMMLVAEWKAQGASDVDREA